MLRKRSMMHRPLRRPAGMRTAGCSASTWWIWTGRKPPGPATWRCWSRLLPPFRLSWNGAAGLPPQTMWNGFSRPVPPTPSWAAWQPCSRNVSRSGWAAGAPAWCWVPMSGRRRAGRSRLRTFRPYQRTFRSLLRRREVGDMLLRGDRKVLNGPLRQ